MFHSATDSRIREVNSACTVEHRVTLHYRSNSSANRVDDSSDYSVSVEEVV